MNDIILSVEKEQKYLAKEKRLLGSYETYLFGLLLNRFNYDGLPINRIDVLNIEKILLTRGKIAFWMLNDSLVYSPCYLTGKLAPEGTLEDLTCITLNGVEKVFTDWRNNENVVLMLNNRLAVPETLYKEDARILKDIDTSLVSAIINTRYTELLGVSDERDKKIAEQALKDSSDGVPAVILSRRSVLEEEQGINAIPLHNVRNTDLLQYLYRAYDDTFRRFWSRAGLEICTTTKLAQQTKEEVTSGHNARMVETLGMLEEREKALEELNHKFGLTAKVSLSDTWLNEYAPAAQETEEEQVQEGTEDARRYETDGRVNEPAID